VHLVRVPAGQRLLLFDDFFTNEGNIVVSTLCSSLVGSFLYFLDFLEE
jgi:hypothetical protein